MVPIGLLNEGSPQTFNLWGEKKQLFVKRNKAKNNKMRYTHIHIFKDVYGSIFYASCQLGVKWMTIDYKMVK